MLIDYNAKVGISFYTTKENPIISQTLIYFNIMDANEILEKVLEETRESRAGLAKSIGLQPHRLQDIARGKSKEFPYEVADKIASTYPQFSRKWLLTGEGDMLVGDTNVSGNHSLGVNNGSVTHSFNSQLESSFLKALETSQAQLTTTLTQLSTSQTQLINSQSQTTALIEQLAKSQQQISELINLLKEK